MGFFKRLCCLHWYEPADPFKYGSYASAIFVCKYCGKVKLNIDMWKDWC